MACACPILEWLSCLAVFRTRNDHKPTIPAESIPVSDSALPANCTPSITFSGNIVSPGSHYWAFRMQLCLEIQSSSFTHPSVVLRYFRLQEIDIGTFRNIRRRATPKFRDHLIRSTNCCSLPLSTTSIPDLQALSFISTEPACMNSSHMSTESVRGYRPSAPVDYRSTSVCCPILFPSLTLTIEYVKSSYGTRSIICEQVDIVRDTQRLMHRLAQRIIIDVRR